MRPFHIILQDATETHPRRVDFRAEGPDHAFQIARNEADGVHVEADFIAAIRGERQPARAVPRFEDARQLLQFGEVWKESSQKGGWCDLP